jgi:AraC-like DNA-binding protein
LYNTEILLQGDKYLAFGDKQDTRMDHFSDSVSTVRSILAACEQAGCESDKILAAANLRRESLSDPERGLPLPKVEAVWQAGFRFTGDPLLAFHAAENVQYGSFGALDFICAAASTVYDAIRRLCWYFPLINNSVILAAEAKEHGCALYLGSHLGTLLPHTVDFTFSSILLHTRQSWGIDWAPQIIECPYPRPGSLAEHLRIFRCSLLFNAPIAKMVIPRSLWDTPIPTANPELLNVLERQAAVMLSMNPPPGDIEAKIRSLIGTKIHEGGPYIEKVAREMGFSPRNLQRKLRAMDKSFAGILDDVRAQAAKYYLRDSVVPVGEIATILGFEEASSFTRAFKRWLGMTPLQYRKNNSSV